LQIPVEISTEFAGLVEAWAAGVTWKELMDDSEMDEGDVARLLRRSIDLLAQVKPLMTLTIICEFHFLNSGASNPSLHLRNQSF